MNLKEEVMKKVLVLMLVLAMVSLAQATVVDVTVVDLGTSGGRLGGSDLDELQSGDIVGLMIVLNVNPGSFPAGTYPSYDGYVMSAMDLTLTASVTGSMSAPAGTKLDPWIENADWTFPGTPAVVSDVLSTGAYASMAATLGTTQGIDVYDVATTTSWVITDLLGGMKITADGVGGDIGLSWGLATTPGQYYDYVGDGFCPDPVANNITLGDLGGQLVIHAVPEPMTIALLGLGGLFLRRRK